VGVSRDGHKRGSRVGWTLGLASALALVSCGPSLIGSATSAPTADAADTPSTSPTLTVAPTTASASSGRTLDRVNDDVRLTVTTSSTRISPGDEVVFTVTLRNERTEPLMYSTGGVCFPSLTIEAPLPIEPAGRTDWTGAAARFKDFALTQGYGPGGVPATNPVIIQPSRGNCPEADSFEAPLEPGAETRAAFKWHGAFAKDIPVLPGTVDFEVSAGYDRQNGPPSYPPDYTGVRGSWFPVFKHVTVRGEIDVDGPGNELVTAGEAVDAALSDKRFKAYLEAQPDGSCDLVNLYLADLQGKYLPKGPAWMVELFCEIGVPRHYAFVAVDPFTGDVRGIDICDKACVRDREGGG